MTLSQDRVTFVTFGAKPAGQTFVLNRVTFVTFGPRPGYVRATAGPRSGRWACNRAAFRYAPLSSLRWGMQKAGGAPQSCGQASDR